MSGLTSKKYFNCRDLKHSINFFYDSIAACCSNGTWPVLYPDYKGENIDWNDLYQKRIKISECVNSDTSEKNFPDECRGCSELNNAFCSEKPEKFDNYIDKMYFHHYMSCNAKCVYCVYSYIQKGFRYNVLPLVKSLIENNILSKNAAVFMSGGEITIAPEFEELFQLLSGYLDTKTEILTSGIKYCRSIEEAFIKNKCMLMISLDAANADTYKKIKKTDAFNTVINNLKKYISASGSAGKNITMKYIIIDGINDNSGEITDFVNLVRDLGIKNIRLDFDYDKYKIEKNIKLPEYYFDLYEKFNAYAASAGLNILTNNQIEAILNANKKHI